MEDEEDEGEGEEEEKEQEGERVGMSNISIGHIYIRIHFAFQTCMSY